MTVKANAHFVDCDKATGTVETWQDNRYSAPDSSKTQIWTVEEFLAINDDATGGGTKEITGDYELMADLDMTDVVMADGWNTFTGLIGGAVVTGNPVNPEKCTFTGTFDGRNHTISNLNLTQATQSPVTNTAFSFALFAETKGATINNLHLRNCTFTTNRAFNCGLMIGVQSSDLGGIGEITQCSVEGAIVVPDGIISKTGGFAGSLGAIVNRCYAKVDITWTIDTARLRQPTQIGGFMGHNGGFADIETNDCYCQGTLTDVTKPFQSLFIGGFLGADSSMPLVNCYSAMIMNINQSAEGSNIGGFDGERTPEAAITSSYWDSTIAVTTLDESDAVESNTTDMYQEATFVDWDFDDIWSIDEGNDYPTLQWEDDTTGRVITGTQDRTIAHPQDWAHLEGEEVQVLGDGSYLGTDTVSNGEITLDDNTTVNHVGLRYESVIVPMKLDGESMIKRIRHLVLNVFESLGGDYGRESTDLKTNVLRSSGDVMDTDASLHTGLVELPFPGRFDRQGDIRITQDEPLPFSLVGIGVKYSSENPPERVERKKSVGAIGGSGSDVKRIRHIILNVFESLGGDYGREADDLKTNVLRTSGDVMDTDAALHTGLVELPFPGTNDRQGDIWVTQDDPLPFSLIGIGVKYSQEDI